MTDPIVSPLGYSHVRLTVTDIHRSKAFYSRLFGMPPGRDFSDQVDDPTVRTDPWRTYGGCSFTFHGQTLGLRPVASPGDTFDPDRVGLDHLSLRVGSVDELHAAAERLTEAGIPHGDVTDLPPFGLVILSLQDPDGINLELAAPRP
ncbi:VOC family protein [Microlunatus antarcticus]|uniref:Catechol 2,3-dioxygenase-like lactoylglutathione lyase family enzyme n=1 Tax=Microlunatus antarcticus TaxID=53388 RepID=A0A7W5JY55_9ACTN|nr:catechol 2,3-dioxygenase-like lactoylglutathione lyase family enzyme [Microlunatus antarcticus]